MSRVVNILSVRQPWAYLLAAGIKDVENRSWTTRYRGELFIHASKQFDWGFCWYACEHKYNPSVVKAAHLVIEHFGVRFIKGPDSPQVTCRREEFGAIIGKAVLHDVVADSSSIWADPYLKHWIMKRAIAIKPIPMKGKLGLFKAEVSDTPQCASDLGRCLR